MLTRRESSLLGVMLVLALFLICSHAKAATPLPPAPANGWCYDSFVTPNYNGVRACPGVVPPPVDPGAYTSVVVNWIVYPSTPARATDVRVFGNVFGRINSIVPAVGWDFANGATVQLVDNSVKYYRLHVSIPISAAPTNVHFLKAVSYGKSPANLRANFAIVATGAPWPTGAATPCYAPNMPFSDARVLSFAYIAQAGTARCQVPNEFDVLADAVGNGTMALSWQ